MALRQRAKKAHAKGANAGPNKTGAALSGGGGGAEASPFGKAADTLGSTTASLLIFLLAFGLHVNTLEGEFVYDDARGVVENGDVTQANAFADLWVNDFWGKPMERYQSHKSYRPLTVLTFRMNHHLHGLDPFGFHVTNVVLHGIVCVLFLRASAVMIGRLDVAFVAALLFTAHSIHTEAVANVVGRAELLSGMFVMLAFLAYHQAASAHKGGAWAAVCLGGSMLFAAAAMLCKEQGITVLGLVAAYDAMVLCSLHPFDVPAALAGLSAAKHSGLQFRYAVITVTGVALLAFRVKMMGEGGPIFNEYELPALGCKDPTTRALTFNYYAAFNFHLLALPLSQSSDWSYSSIPLVESIADQRFATTGATYAGVVVAFVALVLKARSASGAAGAATGSSRVTMAALLGFVWMLVAYVPSSNLFFNVGFVIAERILYLPSMGYCIVLGTATYWAALRAPKTSALVLAGFVLFLSGKTIQRNAVWRSDFLLHEAGAREHPTNIKLVTNYAVMLHERAKDASYPEKERTEYIQQAEKTYQTALTHMGNQRFPNLYLSYGNLYQETGRADDAVRMYSEGLQKIDRTRTTLNILNNLATIYYQQKKFGPAERAFKQAVEMKSDHWSARNGLAVLYAATKRADLAEEEFKEILRLRPGYVECLFNYGTMLAVDDGRLQDAKDLFNQVLKARPSHAGAASNLKYVDYQLKQLQV